MSVVSAVCGRRWKALVLRYPLSPGIKSSDLHIFNFEENGGTRYTSKASSRHNHHHQHHHHHSSYGHLVTDSKDKVSGGTSTSNVPSGIPILYEDASGLKKTDVESSKMASPWKPLHINVSKSEDQKAYEKPLHSPISPTSSLPEHIKCNILITQMDTAYRGGPQVGKEETCVSDFSKSPSLQDTNVRSPASTRAESIQSTGSSSSKQETRPPRIKKLTRQFSFNHSDEDDLPPALAAVAAESAAEHRAALLLASSGNSQASSVEKSPSKVNSSFTLEPGDLLMDFTEATPMIKAYPADPSNSFFDPFTTMQPYPVDLLETPIQQYSSAQPSPKRMSPAIHLVPSRQLKNQAQAMQGAYSSHISLVDSSEARRRELEREKMMKRLLMTEL